MKLASTVVCLLLCGVCTGQLILWRAGIGDIPDSAHCHSLSYSKGFDYTGASLAIGYNGGGYPCFRDANTVTTGVGNVFTLVYEVDQDRWRFPELGESQLTFNLGQEGFVVVGKQSAFSVFDSASVLYRTDVDYSVLHQWSEVSWIDSLHSQRNLIDKGNRAGHTYFVTDSSLILSYHDVVTEYLTEAPYTERRRTEEVLSANYWMKNPTMLLSNFAVVFPACDSLQYTRVGHDTLRKETYGFVLDPTSFEVDTVVLDHPCASLRYNDSRHALSLALVSLDMRQRRPPTCMVDLVLSGDTVEQTSIYGDFDQEIRCRREPHPIVDTDVFLSSNGGRIQSIVVTSGSLEDCITYVVDTTVSQRYAYEVVGGDLHVRLRNNTAYDWAEEALKGIQVLWCDDISEAQLQVEIRLTTGQSINRVSHFSFVGAEPDLDGLPSQYTCLQGGMDTIEIVAEGLSLVQAEGGTVLENNDLVVSCTENEVTYLVQDSFGCFYRTSLVVTPYSPSVANVFSPNGDGVNDYFNPCYTKDCAFRIYDVWGNQVFEGNVDHPWDGTCAGRAVAQGVYTWMTVRGGSRGSATITLVR